MRRYSAFLATKRGMASALHFGDPALDALPDYFYQHQGPALQGLLDAAAAAGEVRGDLSARDLLGAVVGPCMHSQANQAERMVDLLVDGLRYGARTA